jgi:porphyrinogen peroxidase
MQSAIAVEDAANGLSIEWTLRGDAASAWNALRLLDARGAVVGLGAPLVSAVGADVPGLVAFSAFRSGVFTMPATQHHLWTFIPGSSASAVFDVADRLARVLGPVFAVAESTTLFRHKDGRDLSDYKDGSANPVGDAGWEAALIADGNMQGGSFALTQRYLHFRERFFDQAPRLRDEIIGRRHADDSEIADAPITAHVKRTEQESFDPPAFLLRRSMPWGDPRRSGLQFIAFMADLERAEKMLARMIGDDGPADALLGFTQAETGAYYYCPPQVDDRLKLPDATVLLLAPAPGAAAPPMDEVLAASQVRLRANGPYALDGNFVLRNQHMKRAELCRCGASKNKPFCDKSHEGTRFRASGEPEPISGSPLSNAGRVVSIRVSADGPLVLSGPVEIVSESGTVVGRSHTPTLCRCGHSQNKPYCDGAHALVGFRATD